MLCQQFADHFEVAELLDRDVLKHVADAGVLDVERLHPILEGRRQFAGCSPESLKEIRARSELKESPAAARRHHQRRRGGADRGDDHAHGLAQSSGGRVRADEAARYLGCLASAVMAAASVGMFATWGS